jgi:hypothetical protein
MEQSVLGEDTLPLLGDGHPHYEHGLMIFDTYPDRTGMQSLFSYHIASDELNLLGQFRHSRGFYGETRCDLHPRLAGNGRYLFFDSVFSGRRQLHYIILNFDTNSGQLLKPGNTK